MVRWRFLAIALALLVACEGEGPGTSGPDPDRSGGTSASWTIGDVQARLRANAVETRSRGVVQQDFMGVPGSVLEATDAELQVYLYPSARARARATAAIDPARVAPPTLMILWIMPPSLVTTGNAAVIVLTRDEALRDRIHRALLGG